MLIQLAHPKFQKNLADIALFFWISPSGPWVMWRRSDPARGLFVPRGRLSPICCLNGVSLRRIIGCFQHRNLALDSLNPMRAKKQRKSLVS